MANRLLLDQCKPSQDPRTCLLCKASESHERSPLSGRLHWTCCSSFEEQSRYNRHNAIRDELHLFLQQNVIQDQANRSVQKEKNIAKEDTGIRVTRTDILLYSEQGYQAIDVTVANPSCATYLNKGSHRSGLVAASHLEEVKRKRYSKALSQSRYEPISLVPFAVEMTGALGKEAEKFLLSLKAISSDPEAFPSRLRYFRQRLQVLFWRQHATDVTKIRDQVVGMLPAGTGQ